MTCIQALLKMIFKVGYFQKRNNLFKWYEFLAGKIKEILSKKFMFINKWFSQNLRVYVFFLAWTFNSFLGREFKLSLLVSETQITMGVCISSVLILLSTGSKQLQTSEGWSTSGERKELSIGTHPSPTCCRGRAESGPTCWNPLSLPWHKIT